jgi:hypothetical protein
MPHLPYDAAAEEHLTKAVRCATSDWGGISGDRAVGKVHGNSVVVHTAAREGGIIP